MIDNTHKILAGYKKTEMGLIPLDWDVENISELSKLKARIGWQGLTTAEYLDDGAYYLVTGTDFQNGRINWDTCNFVEKIRFDQDKHIQLVLGDVLVTKDGTIGKVAFINRLPLPATLNSGIFVIRPKIDSCSQRYLFYIFNSNYFNVFLNQLAAGSTISHLYQKDFINFKFPIPKDKTEQTAITSVFSDVDTLIQNQERLIEKKKNIKQGAMQELLTGRKRLPGFSNKWNTKELGRVLKVRHGKSQKNVAVVNGKYPILATGGEIGRTDEYLYDKPSVLIGRKGTIDIPQYMDTPFWTVDTLFYTEIHNGNNAKFLFYKFQLIDWYAYNEASGVPSLNAKTIEGIKVKLPPDQLEQTAIADVLSAMDAEIEKLESQLNKYRNIKQGMMQNLLTGKIRLNKKLWTNNQ